MKKIMRGVLLFGMLGGMLLSCGSKKEENNSQNQAQTKSEEKVFKIGIGQIVDHPALNDARQGFKDALNLKKQWQMVKWQRRHCKCSNF